MGFLTKDKPYEPKQDKKAAVPVEEQWQYLARNLAKVAGVSLENDFNKLGQAGWEFVAMASGGKEGYAIFKRRKARAGSAPPSPADTPASPAS